MTVEEAIKIIRGAWSLMCQTNIRFDFITDYREAAEIAVKALNEVQKYREIGTVEECLKAVEKQTPRKCIKDSCPDHTHYKCPSCGQIELSIYKHGFPRLGRITKYCENCGQAIDENLEGMEDENT